MLEVKKNAGLYIRVSTEHQVKEGYSIDAQNHNLTNFAKQKNLNICGIYIDAGISGKSIIDRPEVNRLIQDIINNRIDIVVLYKFDRLTRSMADTEDIIKLIQKYGVEIHTLSEGIIDVNTATGRFTTRISGAVAQLEREQIVERIKVAFEQKVRDGYSLASATTCYGYDRKKGEKIQIINFNEAKIVRKIFKMYIENKSFTEIANTLNFFKIPTKLNEKKQKRKYNKELKIINFRGVWQSKTIKLILTNPTYIGKVRYGIKSNKYFEANGKHEPIIDIDTWNKVQEKIAKMNRVSHSTNHGKDDRYFLGTLRCGICGKLLTTSRTGGRVRKDGTRSIFVGYRCVNRELGLCVALGMSHSKVEKAFLDYLGEIEDFTEIDNYNFSEDSGDILENIKLLQKKIANIRKKKQEIMKLFISNQITNDELIFMRKELDANNKLMGEELAELEKKYYSKNAIDRHSIAKSIRTHWENLKNREKMDFLNNFVKEIVIINNDKNRQNGKIDIINVVFYE